MKALPALLALAGCNSIFGLDDEAKLGDADIVFPDGELPTFKLRYLHATTRMDQNAPAPIAAIGIDPAPRVRLGPVGGALVDAEYVVATGEVRIPIPLETLLVAPWRVEYTLDGVVHEVIWQPETTLMDAKLAEPLLGRQNAPAPPADSGYNIQPTGGNQPPVGGYSGSRVFTTGVFLDIRTGKFPSNTQVDGPATTFVGKLGSPDMTLGDNAVLVDYEENALAMCKATANGFGVFEPPALATASRSVANPPWTTVGTGDLILTYDNESAIPQGRLGSALTDEGQSPDRSDTFASAVEHGITVNFDLPPLVIERPVSFGAASVPVPGPMMLMLAQCNFGVDDFDSFLLPNQLTSFPRVTHGFLTDRRTIGGVELVSSIVSIDDVENGMSRLNFGALLALTPITLTAADSTSIPLSDGSDVNTLVAGPVALDFAVEDDQIDAPTPLDYFEVTVFEIAGGALIPKRIVTTTNTELVAGATAADPRRIATPIALDLTGFSPGTYVLRIRSVSGVPRAKLGDFETLAYPYSAASVFTRAFLVN